MTGPESQSDDDLRATRPSWRSRFGALALAGLCLVARPAPASEPVFSLEPVGTDSPIGRVEYHPGRGLRLGETGLTIGGFAVAEAERLRKEEARGALEGVNFFLFFDPVPFAHGFAELELGPLVEAEEGRDGLHSNDDVEVNRLYADFGTSDALNLRFGKFLAPVGRWSPAPIEPLTWTASEPLVVEEVFDEEATGAMAWGTFFPRGGAFSYSLYGTFLDPIAPDPDAPPAEHSAGAYFEWSWLGGPSLGASYFASEGEDGRWNHLGGGDFLWRPHDRLELSGESLFGEGTQEEGFLWGLYGQAVVELVPTLYGVGRYERFEPAESSRGLDLFAVGLVWEPVFQVRLKADYRFVDHFDEIAEDLEAAGFHAALSVVF